MEPGSSHLVLTHHRDALGDGAGLVGDVKDAAPAGHQPVQQFREPPKGVGPEHQVHLPVALFDLLGTVGLLGHAAAHADKLVGFLALGVDQRAHVAQHPHLGVLPDGAGIDEDEIGLGLAVCKVVAHLLQVAPQPLGVGLVLLAAVGIHKGQRGRGAGGVALMELVAEVPLTRHVGGGNFGGLSVQNGSSRKVCINIQS